MPAEETQDKKITKFNLRVLLESYQRQTITASTANPSDRPAATDDPEAPAANPWCILTTGHRSF